LLYCETSNQITLDYTVNSKNKKNGGYLAFETTIADIDGQIAELTKLSSVKGIDYSAEIRHLQQQQVAEFKKIYSNLSAWQTVQVARHPKRPLATILI